MLNPTEPFPRNDWLETPDSGQGQSKDIIYTPSNSDEFFAVILDTDTSGEPAFLRFLLGTVTGDDSTNTYALIDFSTRGLDVPIQPGNYADAQRASFADTRGSTFPSKTAEATRSLEVLRSTR